MENQRTIKLAFIVPSLAFGGGIEAHLIKMFRAIDRTRFSCALITLFEHPERPDLYGNVPDDVQIIRLDSRGIGHMTTWVRAYRALYTLQPDIVVSSMFSPNTLSRVLKPLLGYRVVAREHNTYEEKRWYHRLIDHCLAYMSDAIVAVSSDVADFLSKQARISRSRITVINNGVDVQSIQKFIADHPQAAAACRAEIGLAPEEKIILNVARIKPTKDHALLLDAFVLLRKKHPAYHLVIAGDGSERPHVEEKIRILGLEKCVHLIGYRSDVFAWYMAADMFVLSSKREGFPNVGIEAMAFGLPFITTRVAGVEEFVKNGQNGLIVERSAPALFEGMASIALLTTQERLMYSNHCVETANRFNIVRIVANYSELFEDMVAKA